jgi:hypothetical protein
MSIALPLSDDIWQPRLRRTLDRICADYTEGVFAFVDEFLPPLADAIFRNLPRAIDQAIEAGDFGRFEESRLLLESNSRYAAKLLTFCLQLKRACSRIRPPRPRPENPTMQEDSHEQSTGKSQEARSSRVRPQPAPAPVRSATAVAEE